MLTAVNGATTVTFAYDPIGRLTTVTTPASTTFPYDSDRLSAEYNASGTLLRRYVHSLGPLRLKIDPYLHTAQTDIVREAMSQCKGSGGDKGSGRRDCKVSG